MSISFSSLAALVGSTHRVQVSTSLGVVSLEAVEARHAPEPRVGGAVLLRGPREPELSQASYPVRVLDGRDDVEEAPLFLVPVDSDANGMVYEAVFG